MKTISLYLFFFSIYTKSYTQVNQLTIDGALELKEASNILENPGTIRWTGIDFEGWNGNDWVSLTVGKNIIKDIENNEYKTVKIGAQNWMAENLRVTRYNNGTQIDLISNDTEWSNLSSAAYTWYNNTRTDYGAIYNYFVASDTNSMNICPVGWHVPTQLEWDQLNEFLDTNPNPDIFENDSALKMKETGLSNWMLPNTNATNESGFTALPGGTRNANGNFDNLYISAEFWSSTENNSLSLGIAYALNYISEYFLNFVAQKERGLSIRCVKD